ncbi:sensor histidine kinase [Tenacibaculum agarivorans]|uniref:sensor histidine kinase n=1 Tax=Tenacibaculum agarivorans TaxID=1908389 RepID=UPI00094BBCB4|nr:PAS domain-containing sensor histidine kinase [Tenacibaculum agarivorans]
MREKELEKEVLALKAKLNETEAQLRDRDKILRVILEDTMTGFWDWSIQENIEYLCPTFKKMFGYADDEMPNHPDSWQKIVHPDDLPLVFEALNKHIESKGELPYSSEVRYYHKDGTIVWVYCKGKVIEWDAAGKPLRMVGCHINITPLKNALNKVLEHQEELKIKNKELEHFAYIASHNLNEPIRTIDSFVEIIKEEYHNPEDKNLSTYFSFIHDASLRMQGMISNLLDYSRLGKNRNFYNADTNQIIKDVIMDLNGLIRKTDTVISIPELPKMDCLPSEIRLVFQNLIANGIKFQTIDSKPKITISWKNKFNFYEFCVEDNGIGIPNDKLKDIFQIFTRLHNFSKYEGQGIGLAFCKKIIEIHEGKIWVESSLNKGSRFYFTISKTLKASLN